MSSALPAPRAWTRWDPSSEFAALKAGVRLFDLAPRGQITLEQLISVQRLLLPPSHPHSGRLRESGAVIRLEGAEHSRPPTPGEARRQAQAAVDWLNHVLVEEGPDHDPQCVAAEAMFRLTAAHPFMDGNGRVALTVVTWLLLRAGFTLDRDPIQYCLARKPEQYRALACHGRASNDTWTMFFAGMVDGCFGAPR